MTYPCARALRLCLLLALPASVSAQATRSPTVFSASTQMGTISVRAAVVLEDYTVKPLPLLRVVARRTDRPDSVVAQTDLDGRVTMPLLSGAYTLRAKTRQPVAGRAYAWDVRVVVRPSRTERVERVELSNANASSDSVNVKATVAKATPAPALARPAVAAPASAVPAKSPTAKPPVANAPVAKPVVQSATAERAAGTKAEPATASSRSAAPQKSAAPDPQPASPFAPPATTSAPQPSTVAPSREPSGVVAAMPRASATRPRANTSGLLLGLSLSGSSIRGNDLNTATESGAGLSAQVGWGFTKHLALLLDASAARIESVGGNFDLAHVDLGARWHFVSDTRSLVPFAQIAFSGRAAGKQNVLMADPLGNVYEGDLQIVGTGVSLGGGLQYFLSPKVALGGSLEWTTGTFSRVQFNHVSVDGFSIDATSARFNMGFSWFPTGRAR